jgi:hypothetical protein
LAMGTSIVASGVIAGNHAVARDLHKLQRECELRTAAIEAKTIEVRGFLKNNPGSESSEEEKNRVQSGGVVSGSSNLGGSHTASSGVSKVSLSGTEYTP